jgi:pimeloyl-ACP methyl ester carboxylesterase
VLDLVSDVTLVAASLGAPTFHLVGHDWGGAVAWVTASLYPKLVSTLTVLSTPHPDALSAGIADPMNPQHGASNYMIGFRAPGSQNRILANGLNGFKALFTLGGGGIPSKDIAAYARILGTPMALGAAIDWYRATPLPSPRIGPVHVPTLYLWGSEDSVFLRSTAEASAKYVTGPYTFCTLAGKGHWLPEDAPGQILKSLVPQLAGAHPRCPSS